jgi:hypothetical protein
LALSLGLSLKSENTYAIIIKQIENEETSSSLTYSSVRKKKKGRRKIYPVSQKRKEEHQQTIAESRINGL